ncbi:hypothetical protein D9M72_462860 [compost metagenome]
MLWAERLRLVMVFHALIELSQIELDHTELAIARCQRVVGPHRVARMPFRKRQQLAVTTRRQQPLEEVAARQPAHRRRKVGILVQRFTETLASAPHFRKVQLLEIALPQQEAAIGADIGFVGLAMRLVAFHLAGDGIGDLACDLPPGRHQPVAVEIEAVSPDHFVIGKEDQLRE